MSTHSYSASISSQALLISSPEETSTAREIAFPPFDSISSAALPQDDSDLLTQITFKPSLAKEWAIALPIPLASSSD